MRKILFTVLGCLSLYGQAQDTSYLRQGVEIIHHLNNQESDKIIPFFDTSVQKLLVPSQFNLMWRQLEGQSMGEFIDTTGWMIEDQTLFIGLHFEKGDLDIKLKIHPSGKFNGVFFAPAVDKSPYIFPDYVDTSKFEERDFTLISGPYKLKGKLTLPKGKKKSALCILSHGSGPQSMDVHLGPNRMFKDIAYGLASEGIAVFRFHKRTYVYGAKSAEDPMRLTVNEEYLEDLQAAIDTLSGLKEIDARRIYLMGHSQGGILAPRVAVKSGKLKGIIMAAAPITPMDSLVLEQMEYLNALDSTGTYYRPLKDLQEEVSFLRSDDFDSTADAAWLPLGLNAFYWMDMLAYHPDEYLKQYSGKKLILLAAEDYQVPVREAEKWRACQIKKLKIEVIPGDGHSFMPTNNKKGPAQYADPNSVDPAFIRALIKFIR